MELRKVRRKQKLTKVSIEGSDRYYSTYELEVEFEFYVIYAESRRMNCTWKILLSTFTFDSKHFRCIPNKELRNHL